MAGDGGCNEVRRFRRIDDAFRRGDLEALREAVEDPSVVPNGRLPDGFGACLVRAIYHSPIAFIRTLLELGADPRAPVGDGFPPLIDDCQTPLEMADSAGLTDIAALLRGNTYPRRMRAGLALVTDIPGSGEPVRRQQNYHVRLRFWLESGAPVRWDAPPGPPGTGTVEDDGQTLVTEIRVSRGSLINGLFYGIEGMRVGGTRRLDMAPHLAYGTRGVPGVIPAGATLRMEITILEAR